MDRKLAIILATLGMSATAPAGAVACEWHEMAAYMNYEAPQPQRFSPFARADQTAPGEPGGDQQAIEAQAVERPAQTADSTASAIARPRIPEQSARSLALAQQSEGERADASR